EFPVTDGPEMRGSFMPGASNQDVRIELAARVAAIPEYAPLFTSAFGDANVTYTRIALAMSAYETSLLPLDTPWFTYVRGDKTALKDAAKRGALLFYGTAKCSRCHAGDMMTDQDFHNIGIPQFGLGEGDGPDTKDDFGRERVTNKKGDRYKFRTPPLV